jgi:prepilin-type N-terminal cleavage/methylation domain-containing protein/prepilin-type processing-associated H-X9-DG protein
MRKNTGFTLIELLVVIAIIAILAAILFPVFAKARERGLMSACLSNTRQIGLCLNQYLEDNADAFPYNAYTLTSQSTRLWPHLLLPYAKSAAIFACPSHVQRPTQNYPGYVKAGDFYTGNYSVVSTAIPAAPLVNVVYTREIPDIGYATNECVLGGLDLKTVTYSPKKLSAIKEPASIAIFGDGPYIYSYYYTPAGQPAGQTPMSYWDYRNPGTNAKQPVDYYGHPEHLGGCTFTYADGHSAYSKPTIVGGAVEAYGYYSKARVY